MSDRIETVVVVTDKGSQTFDKVGTSATKMGTSIDKASTQSSNSLGKLSKAGAVTGAAFTSMAGVLSIASHANAEAEASQARLTTAIENSGHTVDEYQDQLDAASKRALQLGFDDEDAADSIAKLTTVTGDANKAIDDLSIAEDIARARHISLDAATKLVIAAEQGRVGALAKAGVAVDASMSKEQILDALRAKYAGNAEAYSKTTAAGYDRLKNATENALEAIGAHLGPANQLLMVLPGLSAGFTGVGAAVGALAPEMTAAAAGAALLDVALGPVGIVALAIGATAAIFGLNKAFGETKPAAEDAATGIKAVTGETTSLIQAQSVWAPLSKQVGDALIYIDNASKNYHGTLQDLIAAQEEAHRQLDEQQRLFPGDAAGIKKLQDAYDGTVNATNAYIGANQQNEISTKRVNEAMLDEVKIFGDTSVAGDDARQKLLELQQAQSSGAIGWNEYLTGIIAINDGMAATALAMEKSGETTRGQTEKAKDFINTATGWRMSIAVLGDEYTNLDGSVAHSNETMKESASDHEKVMAAIEATTAKTKQQTETTVKYAQSIGVLDTFLKKLATTHQATVAIIGANKLVNATQALGAAINVVIDNTNSLASQSSGLNDWAMKLINVAGSYGEIDTLLAHGQISLTTYNQAQQAQVDISTANASIQEDILRIQAKQAPLLADAAEQQAKYIDTLADLPATQQLVQLGWMDSAESLKAQNALQLAAAASAGELGDAGKKAAESAITAAAEADPVLKAMLTDMGLISVGADGTITMNFPDSETIQSAVDNLTLSIDALTLALGGVPPVHTTVTVDIAQAEQNTASIKRQLDELNGYYANAVISVGLVGPGVGYTPGFTLGGVLPHAQHGMMTDSRTVVVGEAGPEVVALPGGSLIYPAGASKEMANRMGGRGDIHLHSSTINLYPADTNVYDALRSHLYAGTRN